MKISVNSPADLQRNHAKIYNKSYKYTCSYVMYHLFKKFLPICSVL